MVTIAGLWAYALGQLAGLSTQPAELLAGAAVAVAALLALYLVARLDVPVEDPGHRASTMRQRAHRAAVPRHRDPDAAGRPRPRAPSLLSA